jgi:hypothetical protein
MTFVTITVLLVHRMARMAQETIFCATRELVTPDVLRPVGVDLLAGPSAGAPVQHQGTVLEELATPHAPGLATGHGARQATFSSLTASAQRLREIHVLGFVGEEQVGVRGRARGVSRGSWRRESGPLRHVA